VVKSTGDGLLATFADPADATHAAKGVVAAAAGLGLQVTASVHTGQCQLCLACGPSRSKAGATSTAVISGSGVLVTAAESLQPSKR
jgi:class 3 adenylate cyclase